MGSTSDEPRSMENDPTPTEPAVRAAISRKGSTSLRPPDRSRSNLEKPYRKLQDGRIRPQKGQFPFSQQDAVVGDSASFGSTSLAEGPEKQSPGDFIKQPSTKAQFSKDPLSKGASCRSAGSASFPSNVLLPSLAGSSWQYPESSKKVDPSTKASLPADQISSKNDGRPTLPEKESLKLTVQSGVSTKDDNRLAHDRDEYEKFETVKGVGGSMAISLEEAPPLEIAENVMVTRASGRRKKKKRKTWRFWKRRRRHHASHGRRKLEKNRFGVVICVILLTGFIIVAMFLAVGSYALFLKSRH